ncbi:MAG: ATP-binding protein [Solobacterium sp.]|nr:ATP-binding protein [Solobacterium sp.]MBR3203652.1 ATP-binding protein [Solobacterium sp.]
MKQLTLPATIENIPTVVDFVNQQLELFDCPMNIQVKIELAVDEIFCNIASYAYAPGTGDVTVQVETETNPNAVIITFIDRGIPYDPLAKEDPDVTLSAQERKIGGLGIYLVKKSMDEVNYEYVDGQNILHLKKYL